MSTMNKKGSFLGSIESLANEKGLEKEKVMDAICEALAAGTAKQFEGEKPNIKVELDPAGGGYTCHRLWRVIEDGADVDEDDTDQVIQLSDALKLSSGAELSIGDTIQQQVDSSTGRIAAHTAAQVLNRLVKDAERAKLFKQFQHRVGELLTVQVKRVTRDHLILDISEQVEGLIGRDQMLPREIFRNGDKIRAYIVGLNEENRGPLVRLSRTCPEMLAELFKVEVPEISEGAIEIRSVSRDPGMRSKVSVKAIDTRVDPVGACVGMRGARVQAISSELNGERVDIILWEDDLAQMAVRAIAPAEVIQVEINESDRVIDMVVDEDQLSLAIGRNGQNVRLASQLIGWNINVMSQDEANARGADQEADLKQYFSEALDIDDDVSEILIREGFTSVEAIAYVGLQELSDIDEFDEDIAEELQARAKSSLLEAVVQGSADGNVPQEDLLELEGMTQKMAYDLASQGVVNRERLADMAVDELVEMVQVSEEKAGQLIMTARSHWFDDEEA